MKIYHRLQIKLMILLSVLVLTPVLITGIYAIQVASKTLHSLARTTGTEQARILKNYLESFLLLAKTDLFFLSQAAPMKDYLNLRTAIFTESNLLPPDSEMAAQQAAAKILEQKQVALEQEFLALSRNRRIYYEISYLDNSGQEVVRVDFDGFRSWVIEPSKLQNQVEQAYFKETVKLTGKQVFVSPMELKRQGNDIETPFNPIIRYATNIYSQNGQRMGILVANVDASQFLKALDEVRLVDDRGFYLNHPDPNKCWGSPYDLNTNASIEEEYLSLAKQILGHSGSINNRGMTLIYQQVNVSGSPKQWTLIVQRDSSELLRNIILYRLAFGIVIVVSLLLAVMVAWFLSTRLTRPLGHITGVVEAMCKGELLDNRLEIKSGGEMARLAQAIERMRVNMLKSFERGRKLSK
jgi:HAMP domain-containing protein